MYKKDLQHCRAVAVGITKAPYECFFTVTVRRRHKNVPYNNAAAISYTQKNGETNDEIKYLRMSASTK